MTPNTHHPQKEQQEIWVLDDDVDLCQLICARLNQCGWLSKAIHEPSKLLRSIQASEPDLLIIDQLLPNRKGSHVVEELKATGYDFPILMLSALGAPAERITGLESGADDYLSKPFAFRELQLRIERLLQRNQRAQHHARHTCYMIGPATLNAVSLRLECEQGSVDLSRGDVALLQIFCENPGITLTRQQLAAGCGSLVDARQSRSIDVRISRLRRAFQAVCDEHGAIEAVRGEGYRLTLHVQPR